MLSLPSLPVGGGSRDDGKDLCAQAKWLGKKNPPKGISIKITGLRFEPADALVIKGSCRNASPRCRPGFGFTANRIECYLRVHATDKAVPGTDVTMTVSGKITCPASREAECREFVHDYGDIKSDATVTIPEPPENTTSEETSTKTSSKTPGPTPSATPKEKADTDTDPTKSSGENDSTKNDSTKTSSEASPSPSPSPTTG